MRALVREKFRPYHDQVIPDADLLDALGGAIENFLHYLRADSICYGENVDALIKQVTCNRV